MIQATDNTIQNKWERDFGNFSQHELQKYKNKFFDRDTNLNVITILKRKFQCEKYIAHINNSMAKFLKKWGPLYTLFTRTDN